MVSSSMNANIYCNSFDPAGFWLRFFAYLIDGIVLSIGAFLISFLTLLFSLLSDLFFDSPSGSFIAFRYMFVLLCFLLICLFWLSLFLYFPYMESSSWQATVGKRIMGIHVVDLQGERISFWRAVGRYLAKFLSGLIFNIGYLMVIWTRRKQGLHDMIAGTLVTRGRV